MKRTMIFGETVTLERKAASELIQFFGNERNGIAVEIFWKTSYGRMIDFQAKRHNLHWQKEHKSFVNFLMTGCSSLVLVVRKYSVSYRCAEYELWDNQLKRYGCSFRIAITGASRG